MSEFMFRESFYESFEPIEIGNVRLAVVDSICEFGVRGKYDLSKYGLTEKEEKIVSAIILNSIQSIHKSRVRYDNAVRNGKKGGRPPKKREESLPDKSSD